MSNSLTLAFLAAASGFAATVWIIAAWSYWRRHWGRAFWYLILSGTYVVTAVVLIRRAIGATVIVPSVVSFWLLTVIFVVPPALHLVGWLKTRQILSKDNE